MDDTDRKLQKCRIALQSYRHDLGVDYEKKRKMLILVPILLSLVAAFITYSMFSGYPWQTYFPLIMLSSALVVVYFYDRKLKAKVAEKIEIVESAIQEMKHAD